MKFSILKFNVIIISLLGVSLWSGCDGTESEESTTIAGESSAGESSMMSDLEMTEPDMERDMEIAIEPDMELPPPYEHPEYAEDMLILVNEFRATGGVCGSESLPSVPPLTLNRILNEAARGHAADMAAKGYFAHDAPDGRSPVDRMQAAGYRGSAYGENIAAGNESALETFIQWKNSPGHCVNMLGASYSELGVGYVRAPFSEFQHYWVQNFGHP